MIPRNCTNRKHEYRIHELLSNGQWLNLYFQKHSNNIGIQVWTTALCISKGIRDANEWFSALGKGYRKLSGKTTGTCGIEGLKKASDYICEFANNLNRCEELHVQWADDKRKYAYRRLLKYNFYVDEERGFYHTRNLKYWKASDLLTSELTGQAYQRGDSP